MADYINTVGDYIPLISGSDIVLGDRTPLTETESKAFNATFEHVVRALNRYSPVEIVTQKHYDLARYTCEVVKKRLADLAFTGDGTGGFGMRAIIPEDIYGTVNDDTWELANGLVATNWTIGALITRYSRNDHGLALRDTLTGAAGTPAITRDANNDEWYVLHWGLVDQMATGLPTGVWYYLNNRPRAFKDITYPMTNSEQAYAELGYGVLYEPRVPFRSALQFKPIDGAVGARVAQVVAMRPVGVTFCTQRRLLIENAAITRPAAA